MHARPSQVALTIWLALLCFVGPVHGASAPAFTEVSREVGIIYNQYASLPTDSIPSDQLDPFRMTGGVAAVDYDNDGWTDLFVTRMDAQPILFHNRGGFFEAIPAETLGIFLPSGANGAAWGDIDNDGYPDLYVTTVGNGRNYLFLNRNGRFSEAALERGIAVTSPDGPRNGFGVAFGDYDRDGFLDLFTTSWTDMNGVGNRLFRNRGALQPGFFTDTTEAAGVLMSNKDAPDNASKRTYGFAPRFADLDGDGWPDLLVVADFGTSRLFWNQKDATFMDGTRRADVGTEQDGMGSTVGDFDGDGRLDWFVTSIYNAQIGPSTGNRLYHNLGGRHFEDVTTVAGVRDGGWGWGTSFFDYDNDGDLDLIMTNGIDVPDDSGQQPFLRDSMRLWRNTGNGSFKDVSAEEGVTDTRMGKGLSILDYNNDGALDVFIVNTAGQPVLYRNNAGSDNRWIRVKAVGAHSNRDGIGARITLVADLSDPAHSTQIREIDGGDNFLGQSDRVAHFGLGQRQRADRILVRWPSGSVQKIDHVAANTTIEIRESSDFAQWLEIYFSAEERANPSLSAPSADPDHDGLSNVAEYLFGRNPRQSDSDNPLQWSVKKIGASSVFEVKFDIAASAVEANFRLESSDQLGNAAIWAPVNAEILSAGSARPTVAVQVPAAAFRQFIRLTVEIPGE